MPRRHFGIFMSTLVLLGCATPHPMEPTKRLLDTVDRLASHRYEGRRVGTPGEEASARLLASRLKDLGLEPWRGDFLHSFEFTAGVQDGGTQLAIVVTEADRVETVPQPGGIPSTIRQRRRAIHPWFAGPALQPLGFSRTGSVEADVVFAGYGIVAPRQDSVTPGIDAYRGLDVRGKAVLVLHGLPQNASPETLPQLAPHASLRAKMDAARRAGAAAILVVTGPLSPRPGEVLPLAPAETDEGDLLAAGISGDVAEVFFQMTPERSLAEAQAEWDHADPGVLGFPLRDCRVVLTVALRRETRQGWNVLGVLPADTPSDEPQLPLLCAHYDHLGVGLHPASLATPDEELLLHPGADDNASGVAAVLEALRLLKERPRSHPLLVAFFSGEESGALGARAFLRDHAEAVSAAVNLDMVGRLREETLQVEVAAGEDWEALLEDAAVASGLRREDTGGAGFTGDAAAFAERGIPAVTLSTGLHREYHRPADRPERLNYPGLERVAHFTAVLAEGLLQPGREEETIP